MRNRHRQRGLTMIGFIFTAIVVVSVVMIGFRIMPSYIEYFSVKKVHGQDARGFASRRFTLAQFRRDFDLKASADYIDSVRGSDIEVAKDGNKLVATADVDKNAAPGRQRKPAARLRGHGDASRHASIDDQRPARLARPRLPPPGAAAPGADAPQLRRRPQRAARIHRRRDPQLRHRAGAVRALPGASRRRAVAGACESGQPGHAPPAGAQALDLGKSPSGSAKAS